MSILPKISSLDTESNKEGTYFSKLDLPKETPFNMAKFVVQPGIVSKLDQHVVKEIWCVISGEAVLTHNNTNYFIKAGEYYFMDSHETHQVKNNSETNELIIYSLWWQ